MVCRFTSSEALILLVKLVLFPRHPRAELGVGRSEHRADHDQVWPCLVMRYVGRNASGLGDHVIIDEQDERSGCGCNAEVASSGRPSVLLLDHPEAIARGDGRRGLDRFISASVRHDYHIEHEPMSVVRRRVLAVQRLENSAQSITTVVGRDHHREVSGLVAVRRKRVRLRALPWDWGVDLHLLAHRRTNVSGKFPVVAQRLGRTNRKQRMPMVAEAGRRQSRSLVRLTTRRTSTLVKKPATA